MQQKKELWWKVLLRFAGPCKGKLAASVLSAIISVAGSIVPYLGIYRIIKLFINNEANWNAILLWSGVCLIGYVVQIVFYGISTSFSHMAAYFILERLRNRIAERLMRAPLGTVQNRMIGSIKGTIADRVESIEPPLAHLIPELTSNVLVALSVFTVIFFVDWRMGAASLVTIPLAAIPILAGLNSFHKRYDDYMRANDRVNSVIVEYVEGIEVVKAFNQTTTSYEKFVNSIVSFQNFTMAWFQKTWKEMNLGLAILPTTLLGILPAGTALYFRGELSAVEMTFCLLLSLGIVSPLMKVMQFVEEVQGMAFSVNDANAFLHMQELPEIQKPVSPCGTDIEFEYVNFSYTGEDHNQVLKNISLHIHEGEFMALVGPSGGGKSTMAKLIVRFWDVCGGSIKIGGTDVRQISFEQLSKLISFVSQDNFLFDCSLKENIRIGKPNAADDEVMAAARAAQCEDFVDRLEKGWDTPAGEAGRQLSGGERQRISIARAILKDAQVVILDEATAFTDPENEVKLQRSITALSKGKTLLVIAHRLSTIQNANQIVVLKKGRIVDRGTQKELLERCPLYRSMWEAHIGTKNWAAGASAQAAAASAQAAAARGGGI